MGKRALISGCLGQDGAYLAKFLQSKGYEVIGGHRASGNPNSWRLEKLGVDIELVPFDLQEYSNMRDVIKKGFDEIYNLAAQSFVGVSFKQPMVTCDVDFMGVVRLLDIVRDVSPETKIYQASTSEMFGSSPAPQGHDTSFRPRSPYGVAKLGAHSMMINYRESYGMKCYNGILFNHESPLRGSQFVTKKIADYFNNRVGVLKLGNLDARRDWGFAGEYIEKMWELMQGEPRDAIIATGETHTVREFVEESARCVGLEIEWVGDGLNEKGCIGGTNEVLVEIDEKFYRPAEVDVLRGVSDFEMKVKFKELVRLMVNAI